MFLFLTYFTMWQGASLVAQRLNHLPTMWETWVQSWVRKIPWRRKRQPTPVFLPGKSHGWRILVNYSPQGCRVGHDWATSLSLCKIGSSFIHFVTVFKYIVSFTHGLNAWFDTTRTHLLLEKIVHGDKTFQMYWSLCLVGKCEFSIFFYFLKTFQYILLM